ncbi:EscU/YscU/HrcU family type III secretion system export apparatus switch protein [Sulfurimonas autotrophica]|uniref:FlhB domain-containing protein n=1 Tax=Sulfurimonas autotrophica (strain ATCC BAA-671 / DSM 16294 / JCM 11897 / OK10) TaxID=563040 RepID=E0UTV3_SULAO|nr:EscU/YscU/HrcU family type III secretion system export apparatus switch protein [Sulfurimonas autotrophica]ADN09397.1 FlhB domain-containing protein [Sulfurimonas autotrophica DSM 16294]
MKEKAVALTYDKEKNRAPVISAKGKGTTAQKIIKIAKEHGVPIKKDEDLIELLSKVELNKEVPPQMYKAIAEVFSFIYSITREKQ